MTTGEILTQSWKLLGEPSDLNPSTAQGRIYLLQGVNEALRSVASFKDKVTGSFYRYNQFKDETYLSFSINTGTVAATSTVNTVRIANLPTGDTDISGSTLTIGSESRIVISNTGVACQVGEAFSSDPTGETYTLSRRWVNIPTTVSFIELLKVENINTQASIEPAPKYDTYLSTLGQTGTPTQWYRIGRRLYFNICPEEDFDLRVWYYRMPTVLTTDATVPELPSNFHFGIVLWTVYWGYMWMQEPTDAYAAQRRYEEFMRTTKNQIEVKDMMRKDYNLSIKVE